jgi:hypothetical protein
MTSTHEDLLGWIASLEERLSRLGTLSVAGMLSSVWMRGVDHLHDEWGLTSPLRQTFYLLGLLMNSVEPVQPDTFSDNDLRETCLLLANIYDYYAWQYFSRPPESDPGFPDWVKQTELAMPVFLDYFNRPRIMGTHEQVCDKIQNYFAPFDIELSQLIGISASDALTILRWVGAELQRTLDQLSTSITEVERVRQEFVKVAESDGFDAATALMQSEPVLEITARFAAGLQSLFVVSKANLSSRFGEAQAEAFWRLAVSVRGAKPKLKYPTDRNTAEVKALFEHAPGQAVCPIINSVATGIIVSLEDSLRESRYAAKFYRHRDLTLEDEAHRELLMLFKTKPTVYRSAFEQPTSQFEHDLIIADGDTVLVVECKASRVREPLRDVSKTYERMRDSFRGDNGIQKAFDQGNRIRKRLLAGEDIDLYSKAGEPLGTVRGSSISRCFIICVTAEAWGFMATDLSYFLEKQTTDPFPWCVNILDLSLFVEAIGIRGWGAREFYRFLEQRATLHGTVKSEDELTFAGAFLQNGCLPFDCTESTMLYVCHDFARIFDEISMSKHTGEPVMFKPGGTQIDVRRAISIPGATFPLKWHPERRCFCNSGRKYKNCCLVQGILPPLRRKKHAASGD